MEMTVHLFVQEMGGKPYFTVHDFPEASHAHRIAEATVKFDLPPDFDALTAMKAAIQLQIDAKDDRHEKEIKELKSKKERLA